MKKSDFDIRCRLESTMHVRGTAASWPFGIISRSEVKRGHFLSKLFRC
jgi:hypothetical protein